MGRLVSPEGVDITTGCFLTSDEYLLSPMLEDMGGGLQMPSGMNKAIAIASTAIVVMI